MNRRQFVTGMSALAMFSAIRERIVHAAPSTPQNLRKTASARAWPDATNTGTTGNLTNSTIASTSDSGQLIQNLHILNSFQVNHNNVTLRNCKISGTTWYTLLCNFHTGLIIEDCEIDGRGRQGNSGQGIVAVAGSTVRRCNVWNAGDGIIPGNNTTVEDCWIHDLYALPQFEPHVDTFQCQGEQRNLTIRNNSMTCGHIIDAGWQNAGIYFTGVNGVIENILVEHNKIDQDQAFFAVYAVKNSGGGAYPQWNVSGIRFRDNFFVPGRHGVGNIYPTPSGFETRILEWTNNRNFQSNAAIRLPSWVVQI